MDDTSHWEDSLVLYRSCSWFPVRKEGKEVMWASIKMAMFVSTLEITTSLDCSGHLYGDDNFRLSIE